LVTTMMIWMVTEMMIWMVTEMMIWMVTEIMINGHRNDDMNGHWNDDRNGHWNLTWHSHKSHTQTNYMAQSLSLKSNNSSGSPKNFLYFVKPKSSLPYSQQATTCPYPKPDKSSLQPPIIFL
jgi:hypothetical protein